jgi:hypothetical protein
MASTYITRTPSSDGNKRTWTFSAWFKKGSGGYLFGAGDMSDGDPSVAIEVGNTIEFRIYAGGHISRLVPTQVTRDNSAWYHYVVAVDTTQATSSNRVKVYINGTQVTSFSTEEYMSQNYDTMVNSSSYAQRVGDRGGGNFDGCMAHVHLTDGTAYPASTFGETDSVSGIWKPKTAPSVTYGTNGFFLKFENSGNLDLDSSGNNHTFSTSGTLTQNVDTPSNNFATWNALKKLTITLTNGNTTTLGNGDNGVWSTIGNNSGKWYWETQQNATSTMVGIIHEDVAQTTGLSGGAGVYGMQEGTTYGYYRNNGSSGQSSGFPNPTNSNVVCHALDLDNGKYFMGVNGVFKNLSGTTSNIGTGADPTYSSLDTTKCWFPFTESRGSNCGCDVNFGNGYFGTTAVASAGTAPSEGGIFEYDCPSGYQALCTKGINSF